MKVQEFWISGIKKKKGSKENKNHVWKNNTPYRFENWKDHLPTSKKMKKCISMSVETGPELQRRFFEDFGGGPLMLDP